jgi:hypothetical protein
MKTFELESSNPRYQDIVFMSVHCRKNLTFCVSKTFPNRISPYAELYYINEQDKIELMDMNNRHRSKQGIESFFEESGILEPRLNPENILERVGRKMNGIMI